MPRVMRIYIASAFTGFALAAVFLGLVMLVNVGNLRHLILTSDVGWIAALAFWVLNGIVFSGVQFGYTVNALAKRDR